MLKQAKLYVNLNIDNIENINEKKDEFFSFRIFEEEKFTVKFIEELNEARINFFGYWKKLENFLINFEEFEEKIKEKYKLLLDEKGEIELKANSIHIFDLIFDSSNFPEISFEVSCSKGTYIRSIASDLGKKLNSGGTLIELRRTKSGDQIIEESKSVEEWIELIHNSPL